MVHPKVEPSELVYVGWSQSLQCRGVFAKKRIAKGEVIEVCPILLVPYKSQKRRKACAPTDSLLDNYYFEWSKNYWCFPQGYGILYNHSYTPNAYYARNYKNKLLKFIALKNIEKDEEVLINYNGWPYDKTPIEGWFREHFGKAIQ